LTDAEITMVIFNSFPNPCWLNEFRLARGNPVHSGQDAILEFFMTKKAVQDSSAEDNNKKRKKEEKEKEFNGRNKDGSKRTKTDNMCLNTKLTPLV
jgi:hypothetical protein